MKFSLPSPFILGFLSNFLIKNSYSAFVDCDPTIGNHFSKIDSSNPTPESWTCVAGLPVNDATDSAECNEVLSVTDSGPSYIQMRLTTALELQTIYVMGFGDGNDLTEAEIFMWTDLSLTAGVVERRCPDLLKGSGFYRCPSV